MTAIISRHPLAPMSSLASHVYPDPSQHPHLRAPLSHLSNHSSSTAQYYHQPEQSPNSRGGNEKYSSELSKPMSYGAPTYQSRAGNGLGHEVLSQQGYQHPTSLQQTSQHNAQIVTQNNFPPRYVRPRSPIEEVSPKHVEFKQEPDMYQADSTEQIAPYLQIPLEINSSKGSLSDFAAQITCLFWFESSQTLLRVEEARSTPLPLHPLIPEANPSMGFRKWVTTILSTTQVSTNVVLLALMFVYRLKKMNPSVKGKPGSEYRLLTVALMLGNKFLDDNTYTNKTWGEVSGITVNEIHVMEVEFLSNMRYTLYASKEEWTSWLQKLTRFAEYFDAASKAAEGLQHAAAQQSLQSGIQSTQIQAMIHPTTPSGMYSTLVKPIGTPTNRSLYPVSMPSYSNQVPQIPFSRMPEIDLQSESRKRTYDDSVDERPAKRLSRHLDLNIRPDATSPAPSLSSTTSIYTDQATPRTLPGYADYSTPRGTPYPDQTARLPLPAMTNQQILPQLPMGYPQIPQMQMSRAMASVFPQASQSGLELLKPQPQSQIPTPLGYRIPPLVDSNQTISASASRNNSPLAGVATTTGELLSPMVYGHYRSSPYKPVRTVNSLLAPPPSTSLGNPAIGIGSSDLQYRPLGKQPGQSRVGVVPHIPQTYSQYQWPIQRTQAY